MKTSEYIKTLTDYQLQISFITLGVFFNKNSKVEAVSETNAFFEIHKQGIKQLLDIGCSFTNEFTANQIQQLIKIEMFKRGIESI